MSIQAQWDTTSITTIVQDYERCFRTEIDTKDSVNIVLLKMAVSRATKPNRSKVIIAHLDSLSNSKTTLLCVVEAYLNQIVKYNWSEEVVYYLWNNINRQFMTYRETSGELFYGIIEMMPFRTFISQNPEFTGKYVLLFSNILDNVNLASLDEISLRPYTSLKDKNKIKLLLGCKTLSDQKRKNLEFLLSKI